MEIITIPIFNLIVWILTILPTVTLPANFLTAVDTGAGYLSTLGYFIPLPTVASILGFYIAYYMFKLVFHAVIFFIAFIPFLKVGKRL